MGRAFIGSADDATASITNPAGLVRLTRRQVYFEFKTSDLNVDRLSTADSFFTVEPTSFGNTTASIAFLSFSMPFGERFALGFTRHEFLNYQEEFELDPRPIPTFDGVFVFDPLPGGTAFFGVDGETSFRGATYGVSFSASLTPKVFAGVTLGFDHLSAESTASRFFTDLGNAPGESFADQFNIVTSFDQVNRTEIDDSATGISFVAGMLFVPNDKISAGFQFSKGSTFDIEESLFLGPVDDEEQPDDFPKIVRINVPDRFGAGVTVRPTSKLMIAFDFVHIGYSSLVEDFTVILDPDTISPDAFEVDNVVEIHFGGEYLVKGGDNRVFLRGGFYTAPDHATRFLGSDDPIIDEAYRSTYNLLPRETAVVGTVGAGVVVGPKFQVDFAYVWKREFVASAGIRF
jgi:hypothetical protein